jgi:tetratricopeptide (TPR) repeat protein
LTLQALSIVEEWGEWQRWIPAMERMLAAPLENFPGWRVQLLNGFGRWLCLNRQLDRAIAVHREAEAAASQLCDQQLLAEVQLRLSEDYLRAHQYDTAEQYGLSALAAFRGAGGSRRLEAITLNILGLVAFDRGEWAVAEENFGAAADIWRTLERPTQLARTLKNLGATFQERNRLQEALSYYQDALHTLEKTNSELDRAEVRNNIGVVYYKMADYEQAEAAFREADQGIRPLAGSYQINGSLAQNLGNVLFEQRRLAEAETHFRRAVILWRQLANQLELANTIGSLGAALAGQGQWDAAREAYDEALQLLTNYPANAWARRLSAQFTAERDELDDQEDES